MKNAVLYEGVYLMTGSHSLELYKNMKDNKPLDSSKVPWKTQLDRHQKELTQKNKDLENRYK